jgi:hypothetical protein
MKEKFAKLLLGEDMSGTGKGVSSALALSNAVTNLAASAFGEHRKLEPMAPDTKERWKREVGWLLSVTDHIVEFVPTMQTAGNGATMEIMSTAQRRDLAMNVPALRKLDAMLIVSSILLWGGALISVVLLHESARARHVYRATWTASWTRPSSGTRRAATTSATTTSGGCPR